MAARSISHHPHFTCSTRLHQSKIKITYAPPPFPKHKTPSAGNHALALSWHGSQLGIPVHVFMPVVAPLAKVDKCRKFGANVVITGAHIGEAKDYAQSNPEYAGAFLACFVWADLGVWTDPPPPSPLTYYLLAQPHHQSPQTSSTSTATTTRRSWRARAPSASRCWSRSPRLTTSSSPSAAPVRAGVSACDVYAHVCAWMFGFVDLSQPSVHTNAHHRRSL